MVGRCRTFHAILAFRQHTWSDDVRHGMPSSTLIAHMVVQHRACHDIITLRHDTRSYYGGRGMPSSPLSSSQGRDMSSVACHHRRWNEHMVGRCRVWHDIIAVLQHRQGRMTYYVARIHFPLKAHTLGRRRSWIFIFALGKYTRSNDIGCGMLSSPLDKIHDWTT